MDKILGAAREYLDDDKPKQQEHSQGGYGQGQQQEYQQQSGYGQQSGFQQTGFQQQYDQQAPIGGQGKAPGGGLASFLGDLDFNTAEKEATKNAGSSGDRDMFSSILSIVGQKQNKIADEDIDEDDAVKKHKKTYDDDDDDNDERSLGTAAAMQALKLFNKGETGSSGSGGQSAFLGLAMSEASKLFDAKASQGKVPENASKESTVQNAAEMAMKMYLKSQGQQQGGLMGFASKFM